MPSVSCSLGFSDLGSGSNWEKKIELELKEKKQKQLEEPTKKESSIENAPNLPTFNVASWCSNKNNNFQNQIAQNQFQLQVNPLGPNPYETSLANPYLDPYYYQRIDLNRFNNTGPLQSQNYSYRPRYQSEHFGNDREYFSSNDIFSQFLKPMNKIDELLHIVLIILIFLFIIQVIELILRPV